MSVVSFSSSLPLEIRLFHVSPKVQNQVPKAAAHTGLLALCGHEDRFVGSVAVIVAVRCQI
jgi:hypothetical protein